MGWPGWSVQAEYSVQFCGWGYCLPSDLSIAWPAFRQMSSCLLPHVFQVWPRRSPTPRRPHMTSVPQALTSAIVHYPPEGLGSQSLTALCPHQVASLSAIYPPWATFLLYPLDQGQRTFSKNGQTVNTLAFECLLVSFVTNQLSPCSANGHDCISVKLYLQKQVVRDSAQGL